jgi:hypothetical protein
MSSNGSSDTRSRGVGKKRRARLPRSLRRAIDRPKQTFVDRHIDAHSASGQLHRDSDDRRGLRILDESRIRFQLAQRSCRWQGIPILDHASNVDGQSLLSTRKRFIKIAAAGDTAWKVRKGDAVGAVLFVDKSIYELIHFNSSKSPKLRTSPFPSCLAEDRPQGSYGDVAHAHIKRHSSRRLGMGELNVIPGPFAFHDPAFLAKPPRDLTRRHHAFAQLAPKTCCVYIHTERASPVCGGCR